MNSEFYKEIELIRRKTLIPFVMRDREFDFCGFDICEYYTLRFLHENGPLSLEQLGKHLYPVRRNRLSKYVNSLKNNGYINYSTNQNDKRSHILHLTKKGHEVTEELTITHVNIYQDALKKYSEKKQKSILAALKTIESFMADQLKNIQPFPSAIELKTRRQNLERQHSPTFHGNRSGFIVIVVVGILGALAALAITLVHQAQISQLVSKNYLFNNQSALLAYSGIELGKARILDSLKSNLLVNADQNYANKSWELEPQRAIATANVVDLSGTININDGIRSGILESIADPNFFYSASEIDPWDTSSASENISGRLNLRLRRILNAYGDAHRFVSQMGWPNWQAGSPTGNYGQPFQFTATAFGPRFTSQPALDNTGTPLTDPRQSRALGDCIIGVRPHKGFKRLEEIKTVVNSWANEHLTNTAYLNGKTFFELIESDLSIKSYEDTQLRMKREFGTYSDIYTQSGYSSNNVTFPDEEGVPFDNTPPNLTDLWVPHSVPLINMNSASNIVKSAIFYSLANVGLSAEGENVYEIDMTTPRSPYNVQFNASKNTPRSTTNIPIYETRIGIMPVIFRSDRMTENGIGSGVEGDTFQARRIMSLRDALCWAQGYKAYTNSPYSQPPIDGFKQFTKWLGWMELTGLDPERSLSATPNGQIWAQSDYLKLTLPHLLAGTRRLPAWLGAPAALLSPLRQSSRQHDTPVWHSTNKFLLSSEDFVYKHHLPKICFLPTGQFRIESTGMYKTASSNYFYQISARLKFTDYKIIRSQQEFIDHTDNTSTSDVKFGPEPSGVSPSKFLGVAGLKDIMGDPLIGNQPKPLYSCTLPFDDSIQPLTPIIGDNPFDPSLTDPATEVPPPSVSSYFPNFQMPYTASLQADLDTLRAAPPPPANETFKRPLTELEVWNLLANRADATIADAKLYIDTTYSKFNNYPGMGARLDALLWWLNGLTYLDQPILYKSPFDAKYGDQDVDTIIQSNPTDDAFLRSLNRPSDDHHYKLKKPNAHVLTAMLVNFGIPVPRGANPVVILRNPANHAVLFPGGTYPGRVGANQYMWTLIQIHPGITFAAFWASNRWSDHGIKPFSAAPTAYPYQWAGPTPLKENLSDSTLEDETESYFGIGNTGSNLSPFGGIALDHLSHGNKSTFTDSLIFEPESLLDSSTTTGSIFRKGMISLWYRNPSGYSNLYKTETLFHATLWERVELENQTNWPYIPYPATFPPTDFQIVYRPIYLDVSHQRRGLSISLSQGTLHSPTGFNSNVNMFMKNSTDSYPNLLQPYEGKPIANVVHPRGGPDPTDYLGILRAGATDNQRTWFTNDFIPKYNDPRSSRPSNSFEIMSSNDKHLTEPGVWNRIIFGWDLSQREPNLLRRLWIHVPTANRPIQQPSNQRARISGNNRMMLAFGEIPYLLLNSFPVSPASNSTLFPLSRTDNNDNTATFTSLFRSTTLIDNIDMRIGYPTGIPAGGPFAFYGGALKIDNDFPASTTYEGFRSKRYNITTEGETGLVSEPRWTIDPQFPKDAQLISLGTRIYDVPDLGPDYNSPMIELSAQGIGAPYYTSPQSDFNSPDVVLFNGLKVTPQTKFDLTYLKLDPSGNPLKDRLTDIPWIKEVSWRFIPSGGPIVESWIIK